MLRRSMIDMTLTITRQGEAPWIELRPRRRTEMASALHVVLDISRLLSSAWRGYPSGIDRVEFAYARHWRQAGEESCCFVAQTPWGGFALIPRPIALAMLDALAGSLAEGLANGPAHRRARRLAVGLYARLASGVGRAELIDRIRQRPGSIFLLVSHKSLEQAGPIQALREAGARFVPLVHDLIPITHPEYNRPRQTEAHYRRMLVTGGMADAVIVNSAATGAAVTHHLMERGLAPPRITVAPLGFDLPPPETIPPPVQRETPYFVVLGTLEPRKNHHMLLTLWRDLWETLGPGAPRLVIMGRRGWDNEPVFRMLDRCGGFGGLVEERGQVSDGEVASVLSGARALLFPSFAEGYGIPLVEALTLGVPAICSDIPALVEVGAGVPEYHHPLDGAAWRRAILAYSTDGSPARAAQLARLGGLAPARLDQPFRSHRRPAEPHGGRTGRGTPCHTRLAGPDPTRVAGCAPPTGHAMSPGMMITTDAGQLSLRWQIKPR